MDIEHAQRVLRVLTAAHPTYPMGEDTTELYLGALCERADFDVAFAVAKQWVLDGPARFPKVTELVAECQAEARRRAVAEAPRILDEAVAPDNLERVRELRAQLAGLVKRAE